MKILSIIFLVLCFEPLFSQEKFVTVNGHKFAVQLKGFTNQKSKSPTIVFENGMGMGMGNWDTVIGEISKSAPVFTYNRLGVEGTEKVSQMPTVLLVSENLKALLTSLKIPPPYILVG